jgi:transposase
MVGVSAGTTGRVMIAVDPHKASWTAAAVDDRLQSLATIRVAVGAEGYRRLRRFAGRWPAPSGPSKARQGWVLC